MHGHAAQRGELPSQQCPEHFDLCLDRVDAANIGNWIDQTALRGHVGDRDQFCARTDDALECGEVELPGCVIVDHVDLDSRARLRLQESEVVRDVLCPCGDDAVTGLERN